MRFITGLRSETGNELTYYKPDSVLDDFEKIVSRSETGSELTYYEQDSVLGDFEKIVSRSETGNELTYYEQDSLAFLMRMIRRHRGR
ncbi:MAG: hypothetical protein OXI63_14920 [Candidatus Poribacteria bacterium]|nr:hypothetical protein [Candidatus Poribacteria bacterium]